VPASLGWLALTFAVLDIFSPSIGSSARLGSGFGIGANVVGFAGQGLTSGLPGVPVLGGEATEGNDYEQEEDEDQLNNNSNDAFDNYD
jgi:hypothetical protein